MRAASPILVAEDDQDLCCLVAMLLRDAGYDVREARTGDEALRLAHLVEPLLVLLDVHLPGVCGYEVCRKLREEFGESLPIIFMSGERTESFDRVGGFLLGADDYLVKPFAADELVARVRRHVLRVRPVSRGIASRLTKREQEILRLLAVGMAPAEIAARLVISPKTVATHLEHVFLKLGVQSRAQAVAIAYRDDLLEPIASTHPPTSSDVGPAITKHVKVRAMKQGGAHLAPIEYGVTGEQRVTRIALDRPPSEGQALSDLREVDQYQRAASERRTFADGRSSVPQRTADDRSSLANSASPASAQSSTPRTAP